MDAWADARTAEWYYEIEAYSLGDPEPLRNAVAYNWDEFATVRALAKRSLGHFDTSALDRRELNERLEAALATIDEPYRSIIVMREIQEMKYAEIVDAVEMPLNTVKVYLHRGRRMLRDALRGKV